MINPAQVCLYIPPELRKFKLALFERIGGKIVKLGGRVTREASDLAALPNDIIPIIGCSPQLTLMIRKWQHTGRPWIYWDRGYARRVFATWLPRGSDGGYYRWHLNSFQMTKILTASPDRWQALDTPVEPWRKSGKHIVIAQPSRTYARFHALDHWLEKTVYDLSLITKRPLLVRDKETKRPLMDDVREAHALVTHGSIAAVEAVIMGCPVFVDSCSAAALVGKTHLQDIETPIYPERDQWLNALAYCQFNERELVDGTLWKLLQ